MESALWRYTVYQTDGHHGDPTGPITDRTGRHAITTPNGDELSYSVSWAGAKTQLIDGDNHNLLLLGDSTDWTLGSGDWSIEMGFQPSDSNRHVLWCQSDSGGTNASVSVLMECQATSRNAYILVMKSGGGSYVELTLGALSTGSMNHLMARMVSGTLYFGLNGGAESSTSFGGGTVNDSSDNMRQNYAAFTPSVASGSVAYFRLTNGVARAYAIPSDLLPVGG